MRKTRGKRRQKKLEEKRAQRAKRAKERSLKKQENWTTVGYVTIGENEK